LQGIVDDVAPHPAWVMTVAYDLVAWNDGYIALMGDPEELPVDRRNAMWAFITNPVLRQRLRDWDLLVPVVVGRFRAEAGRYTGDARFAELTASLQEVSDEFRAAWQHHHVERRALHSLKLCDDTVGVIDMNVVQLRQVDYPGLILTVWRLADESSRRRLQQVIGKTNGAA
jgi:hypothetical protein